MENLIAQRVREFLTINSISINSLAKQINVAQATLNPQLRGDRTLAANIVVKILETFPDISAEWLLRGEGEMYRDNSEQKKEISLTNPQDDSVWKAKYEAIKDCYDTLISTLATGSSKRNTNVG